MSFATSFVKWFKSNWESTRNGWIGTKDGGRLTSSGQKSSEFQSGSPIGIMIDGSLDVSRKDQHIVFVRTVDGEARELYIGIRPVRDGGSESIVSVLWVLVDDMLIDRKRIFILATDGAGPMMGEHTGVGARMQHIVPFLLQNCCNHR